MSDLATLQKQVEASNKSFTDLSSKFDQLISHMKKTPATGTPTPDQAFGLPHARKGENPLSSRGLYFSKMIGVLSGGVDPKQAKVELDIHNRLSNIYKDNYECGGLGRGGVGPFLMPLSTQFMQDEFVPQDFRSEMKSLVLAGVDGADAGEMRAMRMKSLLGQGYSAKALSWLQEGTGGAIVAPAEQGELIELLRNKEALVNAGARVVPLPPQGRLKYPRQTSPSNTYWVGENSPITESIIGTGEVTLQAKKLAVLIKAPNELIRFASPAAEALLRDDMTKSLALGLDLAGLEGFGTDTRPLGIVNMPFINRISSSQQTANGDKVVGPDFYRMIAAVEESNAEFEAYIMRPKTLYKAYQLRADAVAQGDAQGAFLFNLIREAQDGVEATIAGYPVVKSTQVSQSHTKGGGTTLTYVVGGMWSDLLIGMFGAIEFAATTMGDTSFANDQTWVRGILSADVQARHQAAFVLLDSLDTTI
jgi:HK97 family phage major capsid protein